jgi:hypothetical protein
MSPHWSLHDEQPDPSGQELDALDRVARNIAEMSGVDWNSLHNHPGFGKNHWRDMARRMSTLTDLMAIARH